MEGIENPKLHADYALYSPNPFFQYGKKNTSIWESPDLYLVDGGDDGQNIPFHPFLNVARNVDIILAYDMSNERDNYLMGPYLHEHHNVINRQTTPILKYRISAYLMAS